MRRGKMEDSVPLCDTWPRGPAWKSNIFVKHAPKGKDKSTTYLVTKMSVAYQRPCIDTGVPSA
jgi:hypothetical protein